jgi:hypothetical protein
MQARLLSIPPVAHPPTYTQKVVTSSFTLFKSCCCCALVHAHSHPPTHTHTHKLTITHMHTLRERRRGTLVSVLTHGMAQAFFCFFTYVPVYTQHGQTY